MPEYECEDCQESFDSQLFAYRHADAEGHTVRSDTE